MLIKTLESLANSETRARRYLVQKCWPMRRRFCVRCRGDKLYRLLDKRYRCASCGYTFHDFTGRWIDTLNLTAAQWLWVTKLFELEFAPGRLALEIGISYPTAFKAIHVIRCALFSEFADAQAQALSPLAVFLRGCRFGTGDGDALLALGIVDKNRHATVHALTDLTPQGVQGDGIVVTRRGAALYSDRHGDYDGIIFTGAWRGTVENANAGKIYTDGADGFWKYLRDFLALRHGVSRERFPLYLIECQFRYNHRDQPLFEPLIEYLTRLLPIFLQVAPKHSEKKNVANLRHLSQ
ncbi:MAG TPA: IS1595 family transposase [Candidatus Binatia bacterium]|nr:IS1595 family transposase [Candidatus Binatia bacterium]